MADPIDTAAAIESDLDQIRYNLAAYCQACDDGRFDDLAALFTPDGTFTVMGATHTGRDDIKAFISAGQPPELRGKHICANSLVDIDASGATATGTVDYIFVGRTSEGLQITSAGRYNDTFVRTDDGWRFRSRRIAFVGEE
jgi:uncharacterized protein (TIGR02246 family)